MKTIFFFKIETDYFQGSYYQKLIFDGSVRILKLRNSPEVELI